MGILPEILTNKENKTDEKLNIIKKGNKSYIIDFKNKKLIYKNGKNLIDDNIDYIKMYIYKFLITHKTEWIHHPNYGANYKELLYGKKFYSQIINAEIKRNIIEGLKKNNLINNIYNLEIVQDNNTLRIKMIVEVKNGIRIQFNEGVELWNF